MASFGNLSEDELREVFKLMDSNGDGYLPVDAFLLMFKQFCTEGRSDTARRLSISLSDASNVVNSLDPENNGFISQDDFIKYFTKPAGNLNTKMIFLQSIDDTSVPNSSSPTEESRSMIFGDSADTKEGLRNLDQKMASLKTPDDNVDVSRKLDALREENGRLTAQVTILEERLKESEARAQRNLEAEQSSRQSVIQRMTAEHGQEIESLRQRITNMDQEGVELRSQLARLQAESKAVDVDRRQHSELLISAQEQIIHLKQRLQFEATQHEREIEQLQSESFKASQALESFNASTTNGHESEADIAAKERMLLEAKDMVRRLTAENRSTKQKLEEVQDELMSLSISQGRSLLEAAGTSWATETNNLTKEELIKMASDEKYLNQQLVDYMSRLVTTIMERDPTILEINTDSASSTATNQSSSKT